MSDYQSSSGEEDVQDAASVHSQRMDSMLQMAIDFQKSKTDEESVPQSTGQFLKCVVPKDRTPSMTPKGKYILGSPSSSAILARNTTFEETKNVTMVTPPTQDTSCTAYKTLVL